MKVDILSSVPCRGPIALLDLVETLTPEVSRGFVSAAAEIAGANGGRVMVANEAIAPMILPDEGCPGSDDAIGLLLITHYETAQAARDSLSKRRERDPELSGATVRTYALKPLNRIGSFIGRTLPYALGLGRRVPVPQTEDPRELRELIERALILGEQPDTERWIRLVERGGARPIWMLNFLDFAKTAIYSADAQNAAPRAPISGARAYQSYGSGMISSLGAAGGRVGWGGRMLGQVAGDDDDRWHQVAIAVYPAAAAMMTMLALPKYRAAHVHRAAALARTRLLATRPLEDRPYAP